MTVHVIPKAIPEKLALELRNLFCVSVFQRQEQLEPDQYMKRFNTGNPYLPGQDENYRASFETSEQIRSHPTVRELYELLIKPLIDIRLGIKCETVTLLAYRMTGGDHFRFHKDDYAGKAGFVYYLNRKWVWDWGGLLLSLQGEKVVATIPEFNKLVIFDHSNPETSPPHCVTPVTSWALEPRYMLVGVAR